MSMVRRVRPKPSRRLNLSGATTMSASPLSSAPAAPPMNPPIRPRNQALLRALMQGTDATYETDASRSPAHPPIHLRFCLSRWVVRISAELALDAGHLNCQDVELGEDVGALGAGDVLLALN